MPLIARNDDVDEKLNLNDLFSKFWLFGTCAAVIECQTPIDQLPQTFIDCAAELLMVDGFITTRDELDRKTITTRKQNAAVTPLWRDAAELRAIMTHVDKLVSLTADTVDSRFVEHAEGLCLQLRDGVASSLSASLVRGVVQFVALLTLCECVRLETNDCVSLRSCFAAHSKLKTSLIALWRACNLLDDGNAIHAQLVVKPQLASLLHDLPLDTLGAVLTASALQARSMVAEARRKSGMRLGWLHSDARLLLAQGYLSRQAAQIFAANDALSAALSRDDSMLLDGGAGTCQLSIAIAQQFPSCRLVALEPIAAPHGLARANIDAAGLHDRIDLRQCFTQELSERDAFDVASLPQTFFLDEHLTPVLHAMFAALKPGGILATGVEASFTSSCRFGAVQRLKSTVCGGGVRGEQRLGEALRAAGFERVKMFPLTGGWHPMIAYKPLQ